MFDCLKMLLGVMIKDEYESKVLTQLDLFMLVLSCFCYAFVNICLLMPCGHLLGKGWPLGSRL